MAWNVRVSEEVYAALDAARDPEATVGDVVADLARDGGLIEGDPGTEESGIDVAGAEDLRRVLTREYDLDDGTVRRLLWTLWLVYTAKGADWTARATLLVENQHGEELDVLRRLGLVRERGDGDGWTPTATGTTAGDELTERFLEDRRGAILDRIAAYDPEPLAAALVFGLRRTATGHLTTDGTPLSDLDGERLSVGDYRPSGLGPETAGADAGDLRETLSALDVDVDGLAMAPLAEVDPRDLAGLERYGFDVPGPLRLQALHREYERLKADLVELGVGVGRDRLPAFEGPGADGAAEEGPAPGEVVLPPAFGELLDSVEAPATRLAADVETYRILLEYADGDADLESLRRNHPLVDGGDVEWVVGRFHEAGLTSRYRPERTPPVLVLDRDLLRGVVRGLVVDALSLEDRLRADRDPEESATGTGDGPVVTDEGVLPGWLEDTGDPGQARVADVEDATEEEWPFGPGEAPDVAVFDDSLSAFGNPQRGFWSFWGETDPDAVADAADRPDDEALQEVLAEGDPAPDPGEAAPPGRDPGEVAGVDDGPAGDGPAGDGSVEDGSPGDGSAGDGPADGGDAGGHDGGGGSDDARTGGSGDATAGGSDDQGDAGAAPSGEADGDGDDDVDD